MQRRFLRKHNKEGMKLDFSVITAVWNAEKSIEACLDSVRKNSLENTEHLVMDNCSSDGTAEIVRSFPGATLHSEKDRGIYDAMNKGILKSKNEILCFLNADDHFLDGTLDAVRRTFESHPESDIVFGNILVNGRECRPETGIRSFRGARIFHPASFIRRTLFDKIGMYDTDLRICADLDFFLRAKEAGAVFTYLDRPLTVFSLGGISTSARNRTAEEVRRILVLHGFSRLFAWSYRTSMILRGCAASLLKRGGGRK